MKKKKIPEQRYRASRICRTLGNPTAYETIHLLSLHKHSPSELARSLGVSIPTISSVLRTLRNLDLVRYEITWREHLYWLKSGRIRYVMQELEKLISSLQLKSNDSP